jgi:hypothetical protein
MNKEEVIDEAIQMTYPLAYKKGYRDGLIRMIKILNAIINKIESPSICNLSKYCKDVKKKLEDEIKVKELLDE